MDEEGEEKKWKLDLQSGAGGRHGRDRGGGGQDRSHVGDYVSGDEKTGVTLLLWEQGRWAERRSPAAGIQSIRFPSSPMPANFGEAMTPRETYDLLAYLLAQKGRR